MSENREENNELTITRRFDAPRELVWRAWADPEAVARWWARGDVTIPAREWDNRPGGVST